MSKRNQDLVPRETAETNGPYGSWVETLSAFYRAKRDADPKAGLFSCTAAGDFPHGWHAAFASGVWKEKGPYGDNFRAFFGLGE